MRILTTPAPVNLPVLRVIIVDDRDEDTYLLSRLLERAGLPTRPLVFPTGEAARDFLASATEQGTVAPTTGFFDVTLPGLTGFELLAWVREQPALRSMTVILLSASDEPRNLGKAAQLGADCYAIKYPPIPAIRDLIIEAGRSVPLPPPRPPLAVHCNLLHSAGV